MQSANEIKIARVENIKKLEFQSKNLIPYDKGSNKNRQIYSRFALILFVAFFQTFTKLQELCIRINRAEKRVPFDFLTSILV